MGATTLDLTSHSAQLPPLPFSVNQGTSAPLSLSLGLPRCHGAVLVIRAALSLSLDGSGGGMAEEYELQEE